MPAMTDEPAANHPQQIERQLPTQEEVAEFEKQGHNSLAATLLFRMGMPTDTEKIKRDLKASIDLDPPITATKVMEALATVALKIASGKMQPAQANAILFAMQTLIGALRVSITEQKWAAKKEDRQPTRKRQPTKRRSKTNAHPQS